MRNRVGQLFANLLLAGGWILTLAVTSFLSILSESILLAGRQVNQWRSQFQLLLDTRISPRPSSAHSPPTGRDSSDLIFNSTDIGSPIGSGSSGGGQFVELSRGKRVYYHLMGNPQGHLIVLLPMESMYSAAWDPVAREMIALGYRVLSFDYYGTGHSDSPPAVADCALYVEMVGELLDNLGFQRPCTLCGFGMGAVIAMCLAAESPERVGRLILLSPGGWRPSLMRDMHTWPCFMLLRLLESPLGGVLMRPSKLLVLGGALVVPYLRAYLQFSLSSSSLVKWAVVKHFLMAVDRRLQFYSTFLYHLAYQFRFTPLFEDYSLSMIRNFPLYGPLFDHVVDRVSVHPKKVLLIWGTDDQMHSYRHHLKYRAMMPHAHFHEIRGGGHLMLLDKWMEISDAMEEFMEAKC